MSMQNLIVDKLNQFSLKLGIVETSTNGMVCSTLATYEDYEKIFKFGLIIRDKSLFYKFDIDESDEFISRMNARKLARYVHNEYDCDVVLSIFSTNSNLKLNNPIKDNEILMDINKNISNNRDGHAYISILVVDKYQDFELKFESIDELRDRLLITSKAINELLYVLMKLK